MNAMLKLYVKEQRENKKREKRFKMSTYLRFFDLLIYKSLVKMKWKYDIVIWIVKLNVFSSWAVDKQENILFDIFTSNGLHRPIETNWILLFNESTDV